LLSAQVPDDGGYFGERLNAARGQIVRAWKLHTTHLDSHFHHTDILGALQLASQIFSQQPGFNRKTLVIFSDMRQSTQDLNLELLKIVPSFSILAKRCGALPDLHDVWVHILGADGTGKPSAYWQTLRDFWTRYIHNAGRVMEGYFALRDLPQFVDHQ